MSIELKNRKQYEELRAHKAVIIKSKGLGSSSGVFVHMYLTMGELLALKHALEQHPTFVGQDVRDYINNAIEVGKIEF